MAEIIPKNLSTTDFSNIEPSSKNPIIEHLANRVGLGNTNLETKLPAQYAEPKLYRAFLNLEVADTQQERERINPSLIESIKEKPDPIILERLAKRAGIDLFKKEEPKNILLPSTPEQKLLSTTPTIIPTLPPKGEKIFTDPTKWEQIIDAAPEEAEPINFNRAFKKAREMGLKEFEYKGDLFNTRKSGETGEEWAQHLETKKATPPITGILTSEEREAIRKTQKTAAYYKSLIPTQHKLSTTLEPINPAFSDYMKETDIKTAKNKDIDANLINANLGPALKVISPILKEAGIIPEITSGKRNQGDWSLHEIGEAIDIRLKNASTKAINVLKNNLPGKPISVKIHGEKGQLWKKDGFEFIIHGKEDNKHLHIELDTEETKAALAEHLLKSGKKNKILQKGLKAYPKLLNKYFP